MPGEFLTQNECGELGTLATALDCKLVRLYREGTGGAAGLVREVVLRLSGGRAIALGNHVFLPQRCDRDLPVLAHELTHCAQYQAWGAVAYFRKGIAAQVRELVHRKAGIGRSPYRYSPDPAKPFTAYGMEQQGQIVEDYFRGIKRYRPLDPWDDALHARESCPPTAPAYFHRGRPPSP